jgi:predicted phosphoadenosine phosphosulfate sulfurtransferase
MLKDIIVMQENKEKKLQEIIGKNEESARRTTIILEKEEREFIDSLIREGKEPGIKPLISKMLDVYRSMMIYDWRFPGEYYCGISRVAFVNVELIDIFIKHVPEEKWREIGKKMGEAAKVSMEATLGIQITDLEKWQEVFKRLRVQGFGDFYLKDKYILVKAPFIGETEIWAGFLEGLLSTELDVKTSAAPFVFEIKEKPELTSNQ